ncbi:MULTISPECIES: lipoprotein LipL45 [Leptospira]|uniref:Sigma factor regulatory protein, FecR/PupR family n=5 Tax=Leptospira borgpetersenii TaxID=174 RepID=M3HPY7_LEPBO|nr:MULTISPECIES: lipoprotein LipL45 [Leptospira]EMG00116.1 sigma factor regulatory protein, FecR/PupR family [Leptospira borgpetersenii str. 200701203]EMO10512.1 sigma factor regulatory protein, FecR/PupR family [Leptospira borgpetersenii str. Noumea 25]EMO60984.1 sigma factor regulatory protein, FecR/PupR family [Leptospira borgpetersenii serovar Pomona str. 200901868]ALO25700.1 sigma factor regulatory protein, FecR/PupR family [Leptospira borgpetersenii serovar Ballum]ANH00539.1 Sigma factor
MKKLLIVSSIVLTTGVLVFNACKKPESSKSAAIGKENSPSAVVVFSVGEAKILHTDLTEEKATLGASLKTGDKVSTKDKSKVDIQFADGSAVRISENSVIDFDALTINSKGNSDTRLALVSGKVFAKVNKASKEDQFSVVTPTAIAGVRGTSFIVDRSKSDKAVVKVLDGAVAVAPRIAILEGLSEEEIAKNENLKKIQQSVVSSEVVLEKNQASVLKADDKSLEAKDSSKISEKNIAAVVKKLDSSGISKKEEEEIRTIVTVDKETTEKMVRINEESSGKVDEQKAASLEAERKKLESEIATRQEEEVKKFKQILVSAPKELKSSKDIVNYYERIEKIIMTDGSSMIGAIVDQQGSTMIVHTEQGIKKINQADVQEVIYDFQTKAKF